MMWCITLQFLVALATAYRYTGSDVDLNVAKNEAQQLYEAGEGRSQGINEDMFVRILGTRSFAQLNATFDCFKQLYGHDINKVCIDIIIYGHSNLHKLMNNKIHSEMEDGFHAGTERTVWRRVWGSHTHDCKMHKSACQVLC